ncbi:hypothetical protein evm_007416 [Chilo suppressalis]|nr:hypothetical protein evm_007416 [Chilo suppressalis]
MDGIGRMDHETPRGPSTDWRALTNVDAAGTNGLSAFILLRLQNEVMAPRQDIISQPARNPVQQTRPPPPPAPGRLQRPPHDHPVNYIARTTPAPVRNTTATR